MFRDPPKALGLAVLAMVSTAALPVLVAAPKPTLAPRSWELQCEFFDPARIAVTLPGDRQATTFWYMIYTVTNETGREVRFFPQFDLVTDTLAVVHGGDNVSPRVFDAIRERQRTLHPFLVKPLRASGRLLRGVDNARTSVAIFRDFDPAASKFSIYIAGLSGEVIRMPNPAFDATQPPSQKNLQFFALRKTLAIEYDIPGDLITREAADPIRVGRKWVMR